MRWAARRLIRWLAWLGIFGIAALAFAQDLVVSAKVDKTSVKSGEPITLTLTLSGDIAGVQVPQLDFPEGFIVAARSQSTNFSIRSGAMERSTNLVYVLVPQQAGTFQLGPFTIAHQRQELKTEPIEITVEKPAVPPPALQRPAERFTL